MKIYFKRNIEREWVWERKREKDWEKGIVCDTKAVLYINGKIVLVELKKSSQKNNLWKKNMKIVSGLRIYSSDFSKDEKKKERNIPENSNLIEKNVQNIV